MRTKCLHCDTVMEVDKSWFGQIIDCEACGRKFRVRMDTGPPSAADGAPNAGTDAAASFEEAEPRGSKREVKRRGDPNAVSFRSGGKRKSSGNKKPPGGGKAPPGRPPSPRTPKKKKRYGCLTKLVVLIIIGFMFDYWFLRPKRIIPPEVHKRAAVMQDRLASAAQDVKTRHEKFSNLEASESFSFFAPYAERENWENRFTEAGELLKKLTERFRSEVAPVLKRNKRGESTKATYNMAQIQPGIQEAVKIAQQPAERMAFLEKVRDNAPDFVAGAEVDLAEIDRIIADLQPVIGEAKERFPSRTSDIDQRFEVLARYQAESRTAIDAARQELAARESGRSADYAVLGDQSVFVENALTKVQETAPAFRAKIGELSRSYVKILSDMRCDYYAVVKREAWDNYYDYPTSHFHTYAPQPVTPELFDYLENLNPEATVGVPTWSGGGGTFSVPPRENWVSGDDDAVYWIEDLMVKPYHIYTLVGTDEVKRSDWVPVSEETYEALYPYLGMEIASKPYGRFEEETSQVPAPAGISLVGDDRYGHWATDADSGRRYWQYAGHYIFLTSLIPNQRYYRNDWELWNGHYRGNKPYFGASEKPEPVYGTGGSYVRTSSAYAGSHFARSGGFSRRAASVRGAGLGARGRGPGGPGK